MSSQSGTQCRLRSEGLSKAVSAPKALSAPKACAHIGASRSM
eukprot:CAMPEP_0174722402 /NCGR_PEP_ID=MMETSP1094-20130205/38369_1 /TAXON_ID=156173 /ORGANISM="Chrysochromulina brevifilum, Strain UTEX LB 985" /LENGTH=41 /DNA_ID= /DNA_START= /DNA_END= /DNA_ORIENTATION=